MKTAFWQASLTASQAGEKSQTNGLEHTIESKSSSTNASQNSNGHNDCINFNINFGLEFSKIKDRTDVQNSKNPLIKVVVKKSMKQIASNSNVENTKARTKTA